jgi:hypothetical protein
VLLVAALTTQLGGAIKSFFTKVIIVPGRAYWAARIDAFGDASMYAAVGSITLDLLGVGQDNLGMELAIYLGIGAFFVFITANWFRN